MKPKKQPVTVPDAESKADASRLSVGDFLSRVSYCKVVELISDTEIRLENKTGFRWNIDSRIVEEECYSASQFDGDNIHKVSLTALVEVLLSARDSAFQLAFLKQPKTEDSAESMAQAIVAHGGLGTAKRAVKSFLKKALPANTRGELRVLTGHMVKPEPLLGRSRVWDLEKRDFRLVDHRSLQWIIIRGVKYELK